MNKRSSSTSSGAPPPISEAPKQSDTSVASSPETATPSGNSSPEPATPKQPDADGRTSPPQDKKTIADEEDPENQTGSILMEAGKGVASMATTAGVATLASGFGEQIASGSLNFFNPSSSPTTGDPMQNSTPAGYGGGSLAGLPSGGIMGGGYPMPPPDPTSLTTSAPNLLNKGSVSGHATPFLSAPSMFPGSVPPPLPLGLPQTTHSSLPMTGNIGSDIPTWRTSSDALNSPFGNQGFYSSPSIGIMA